MTDTPEERFDIEVLREQMAQAVAAMGKSIRAFMQSPQGRSLLTIARHLEAQAHPLHRINSIGIEDSIIIEGIDEPIEVYHLVNIIYNAYRAADRLLIDYRTDERLTRSARVRYLYALHASLKYLSETFSRADIGDSLSPQWHRLVVGMPQQEVHALRTSAAYAEVKSALNRLNIIDRDFHVHEYQAHSHLSLALRLLREDPASEIIDKLDTCIDLLERVEDNDHEEEIINDMRDLIRAYREPMEEDDGS